MDEERRPLYLHARVPIRVSLMWPALMVEEQDRAPRLFPLQRIARIVALGSIEWGQDALLACLEAGIPIVLANRRKRLVGWVTPASGRPGPLARNLLESGQRGRWREALDSWQAAEERQGIVALLRRLRRPPQREDLRPQRFWSRALVLVDGEWKGTAEHNMNTLKPYLLALLSDRLLDAGAPPESIATERHHGILVRCWNILRWDLLCLIHTLRLPPGHRWNGKEAAACFEQHLRFFERRIDNLIEELAQVLDYVEKIAP